MYPLATPKGVPKCLETFIYVGANHSTLIFKDYIMRKEFNVMASKTFEGVASVADTVRLGTKILNTYARKEAVSSSINCAKELASELGITQAKAQKLMEEA